MGQPLKTSIDYRGQTYVDEPVYIQPKREHLLAAREVDQHVMAPIVNALAEGLMRREAVPVVIANPKREAEAEIRAFLGEGTLQPRPALLVGHERVRLRWMTPDGKGGLVDAKKGGRK